MMEILTFFIIFIGLVLIFIGAVLLASVFLSKPYYREWLDHLRYNRYKIITFISLFVLGILLTIPYFKCVNSDTQYETITTYKLLSVDDNYIASEYKDGTFVYVRGSAENSIEKMYVRNPIYIISNDVAPTCDMIKITYKWWIFEIAKYENKIYLNEY